MKIADKGTAGSRKGDETRAEFPVERIRMLTGMTISLVIITVLVLAVSPGSTGKDRAALSQALLSDQDGVEIDTENLTSRIVEQKFQIHMEEMDQETGEIPYVDIWVLNDPFYPLMGEIGGLREEEGGLANKQWQMLGFPDYEASTGTTTGAPTGSAPSTIPVTAGVTDRVLLVEDIYEMRGIRYVDVKVNDVEYNMMKAGSEFAEVFRIQEIKDDDGVIVLCGDEAYEIEVGQLRKI